MIDQKYLIDRNGKPFVLYAGLLDCAHGQGLKRIATRLLQVGTEENAQTWIVAAEVETDRGIFSGIGDATPANVSRAMLTVLPRMAETRAKARALRDAVNVGVAAIEELGEEPAPEPAPVPTPLRPAAPASEPVAAPDEPRLTDKQRGVLIRAGVQIPVNCTRRQASELITRLQAGRAG